MTAAAFRSALAASLPPGKLWDLSDESNLTSLLHCKAMSLARVDGRIDLMLRELDPETTYELLPLFERSLGLPDPCAPEVFSVSDRRGAVLARMIELGDKSPASYERIAAALGYVGAVVEEYELFTCESYCEDHLFFDDWLFAFTLHLPTDPPALGATSDGSCEDYLGAPPETHVECWIKRIKDTHTTALFSYGA